MNKAFPALLGLSVLLASCGSSNPDQTAPATNASDLSTDTSRSAPAALSVGESLQGTIAGQDRDFDYYSFNAKAGERFRISVQAPQGSTLDPYVRLYKKDGWVLLERDDDNEYNPSNTALNSEILFNADADGSYVIEVTSFKLVNDPTAKDNNPANRYSVTLTKR